MKKILYLSNSGNVGGMEVHLLNLVEGMVGKGYQVFVVCPWGEMVEKYFGAGAEVRIDHPQTDIDPFYIFRLIKFIRQNKIDILHAHQLKTVINGLIAGKVAGVPLKIAHIHTPLSQWQISPIKKKINIFVNQIVTNLCADKVVALTEATRKERIEGEGIDPGKIVVIPNGTKCKMQISRPKDDRPLAEKLTIGTLGRLTVEKGHETFLAAAKKVTSNIQHPTSNFVIAGEGNLKPELEQQVKDLGIEDKVTFLGFVPEDRKIEVYSSFDIFVFPSLAEGFGIVLIEAMALGLPCVVSDLPVLGEVGGDAVRFFKAGDSKDLAQKVLMLLEDEDLRRGLGQKARKRVEEKYSMETFVENYGRLYNNLAI